MCDDDSPIGDWHIAPQMRNRASTRLLLQSLMPRFKTPLRPEFRRVSEFLISSRAYACCIFTALFMVLFFQDLYLVSVNTPFSYQLNDAILSVCFCALLIDLLVQIGARPQTWKSLRYFVDVVGTFMVLFSISWAFGFTDRTIDSDYHSLPVRLTILRAGIIAQYGAQLARTSGVLRVLRCFPGMSMYSEESHGSATHVARRLLDTLSSRVIVFMACLVLISTLATYFNFPAADLGFAAWCDRFASSATPQDLLSGFKSFYSAQGPEYFPYEVTVAFSGGSSYDSGVFAAVPYRLINQLITTCTSSGNQATLRFNFEREAVQLASTRIGLTALLCVTLLVAAFLVTHSVSLVVLVPIERLFCQVKKLGRTVFKTVDTAGSPNGPAGSGSPVIARGSRKHARMSLSSASGQPMDSISLGGVACSPKSRDDALSENVSVTDSEVFDSEAALLERLVSKFAILAETAAANRPLDEEQMRDLIDTDRAMIDMTHKFGPSEPQPASPQKSSVSPLLTSGMSSAKLGVLREETPSGRSPAIEPSNPVSRALLELPDIPSKAGVSFAYHAPIVAQQSPVQGSIAVGETGGVAFSPAAVALLGSDVSASGPSQVADLTQSDCDLIRLMREHVKRCDSPNMRLTLDTRGSIERARQRVDSASSQTGTEIGGVQVPSSPKIVGESPAPANAPLLIDEAYVAGLDFSSLQLSWDQQVGVLGYIFLGSQLLGPSAAALGIQPRQLQTFIFLLRDRYNENNPYHNFIHAFDVTQGVYMYLTSTKSAAWLRPHERLAILIAALGHDVGHPGVNNNFLVDSADPLALRFNDKSPLENLHCSIIFEILSDPRCQLLAGLDPQTYREVRRLIIETVLSTDMACHFQLVKDLQVFQQLNKEALSKSWVSENPAASDPQTSNPASVITLNSQTSSGPGGFATLTGVSFGAGTGSDFRDHYWSDEAIGLFKQPENKLLLCKALLHMADIGNPSRPFSVCKQWTYRIMSEFFNQGDRERELGLVVQPLNDRFKVSIPQSQMAFIEFVVGPIHIPFVSIFPQTAGGSRNVVNNMVRWARDYVNGYAHTIPMSGATSPYNADDANSVTPPPISVASSRRPSIALGSPDASRGLRASRDPTMPGGSVSNADADKALERCRKLYHKFDSSIIGVLKLPSTLLRSRRPSVIYSPDSRVAGIDPFLYHRDTAELGSSDSKVDSSKGGKQFADIEAGQQSPSSELSRRHSKVSNSHS